MEVEPEKNIFVRLSRKFLRITKDQEGGKFWVMRNGKVYFTTRKATRKARRIQKNPRVIVRFGSSSAQPFEGRAFWLEDPALYDLILSRYRRKYWFLSPLFVRSLRRRKESGESTAVMIVFGEDAKS